MVQEFRDPDLPEGEQAPQCVDDDDPGDVIRLPLSARNDPTQKPAPDEIRELRKQLSIFMPLSDWKAIRNEAARLHIPMTELCRRWMRRPLELLKQRECGKAA